MRILKNEEIYLKKAQAGDKEAMGMLFEGYKGMLINASHQMHLKTIGDEAVITAQESFFDAIRNFDAASGIPFPAYAKAKVYGDMRTLFKQYQKQWNRESHPIEGDEDDSPFWSAIEDPNNVIEEYNLKSTLQAVFSKLSHQQRRLMQLLYFEDYTQMEAAKIMGITKQSVFDLKRHAFDTLRTELGKDSDYLK